MPRFAANVSWLFTELPFLDRFEAAARAGFAAVEFNFPYDHPVDAIAAALKANHLELVLFNAPPGDLEKGERGLAALPGREAEFGVSMELAFSYAATLGCSKIHVMSGLRQHGANWDVFVSNLEDWAQAAFHRGIELMVEPINPRDVPGYFINRWDEARNIVGDTGATNVKIQLDLYHRQIVEGDLVAGLERHFAQCGHIQIANPPDRGEPDEGEINFRSIFAVIDALGYTGWIGCEYRPRHGTVEGLAWMERLGIAPGR